MIVRRLRLENIRSYRRAEVEFPAGKTLFEGDIGSGKSTILMAVEFALFGLGSARPSSLLRVGEARGSVELEFEVDGREYTVKRTLARKGSSIQQTEGKLKGPDGEEDCPPTEMKERILSILKFREPTDPKARSLIYQYAIYTPQEEMKQVLLLRADFRTQILRRAFGVEEYKTAMENAAELLRAVQSKRTQFEAASKEVPSLKRDLAEIEGKVGKAKRELETLERTERESEAVVVKLEKHREEMRELETQLAHAESDKEHLDADLERQQDQLEETESEIGSLERKRERLKPRQVGAPPSKTVEELKAEISSTRKAIAKHEASEAEMVTKVGQYESVAEKGRCPVCDREASAAEFEGMVRQLSERREKNSGHIAKLNAELEELDALLDKRRDYDSAVTKAKEEASLAEDHERDLEKRRRQLAGLRAGLEAGGKKRSELERRIAVLEGETKELEPVRHRLEAARRELEGTRMEIVDHKSDLRKWEADQVKVRESLGRAENAAAKGTALRERETWLEEFFVPALDSIEKHVMVSINKDFGSSFEKWFGMLVEDGEKEARVDEEFTPIVEQEGFEQDVEALSGGERTSVALAYRLALSQMVQKHVEAGPSTLMLDEPTDGFSKEQLGKVREMLDEMGNPQIVIVSHERELESMADQIFRVAKVDGESKISR